MNDVPAHAMLQEGQQQKVDIWLMVTHQYAITVYDSVEAMSDGEHGAFSELLSYGLLDQLVCPLALQHKEEH